MHLNLTIHFSQYSSFDTSTIPQIQNIKAISETKGRENFLEKLFKNLITPQKIILFFLPELNELTISAY